MKEIDYFQKLYLKTLINNIKGTLDCDHSKSQYDFVVNAMKYSSENIKFIRNQKY